MSFIPATTDHCAPLVMPERPYHSFIPSREEWEATEAWNRSPVNFFTDGSRRNDSVGGGVYSPELATRHKFRLPDHCSVFQAEITAIKEAVDLLGRSVVIANSSNIYSDSQAAVRALDSAVVRSSIVKECQLSLKVFVQHFRISIVWVGT